MQWSNTFQQFDWPNGYGILPDLGIKYSIYDALRFEINMHGKPQSNRDGAGNFAETHNESFK
jgi:hypothetical protein